MLDEMTAKNIEPATSTSVEPATSTSVEPATSKSNQMKASKSATIRFVLAKTLSLLGNSIAGVVLPLILLAKTGDPLAAGTLVIICAVPQVLAGALGGIVLDRSNRRKVSAISDLISAFSVAMLPLIDLTIGLSFGWFVLLGVIGAIGDVPGMTARDTLLPSVTEHDKISLQSFMGIAQSIDSLTLIVGPALGALFIASLGGSSALWVTASLSMTAALVTISLPKSIGVITASQPDGAIAAGSVAERSGAEHSAAEDHSAVTATTLRSHAGSILRTTVESLREGSTILFKSDGIIRTSVVLSLCIVMVLGSYQGLVLPFYFTELNKPELLGYVLSAISLGMLIGSLVYAALTKRLKARAWYILSLFGMAGGIAILGTLPAYLFLLAGAFILGLFSGPISALFGFFVLSRIPDEKRGVVLGTQNSLLLIAAPVAIFTSSVLVSLIGTHTTSLVLICAWLLTTLYALVVKSMKSLD